TPACALARHVVPERAVVHEVLHGDAVLEEHDVGDDPPVAAPPHGLRAHDRGAAVPDVGQQLGESLAELLAARPARVRPELRDLPPGVGGAGGVLGGEASAAAEALVVAVGDAELGGEVADPSLRGGGIGARAGEAAHVEHALHARAGQEGAELVAREAAVAEGQHRSTLWHARGGAAGAASPSPLAEPAAPKLAAPSPASVGRKTRAFQ